MRNEGFHDGRIASSVMERIRREERWAYPASGQWMGKPREIKAWFAACLCAFLVLIGFTFVALWKPSYLPWNQEASPPPLLQEVVGSGELGYAKAGVAPDGTLSLKQMVAYIGDPVLFTAGTGSWPEALDLLLILSMVCMIALILLMNWIAQHIKRPSH